MKKSLLSVLSTVVFFGASLLATQSVSAQTLQINSIGGTSTGTTGTSVRNWTHQGYNPLLAGTASPSATVTVMIDSVSVATTSSTTGAWQYKPTTMITPKSYEVALSSGSQSVLLTLSILEATSSATKGGATTSAVTYPATLPQPGSDDMLMLLAGGIFLVITGAYAAAHVTGYFSEE